MPGSLERAVIDCIEYQKPIRHLLYPLSLLFQWGVILRNKAYDWGWLRTTKVKEQVISIGNLVAGGTGKTPFLMLLLTRVGRGAVLTRGYRTADEPQMIVSQFPHVAVHVGKNRLDAAKRVAGPIFLDDGMQYRKLHRDIEIVLLNGQDLFGQGYFLPRGFLRDLPKRLARADYVVLNHVESRVHFEEQMQIIRQYSSAPIIGTKFSLKSSYAGQKVGLFCGIGYPKGFVKAAQEAGGTVVDTMFLPDHIAPTAKALQVFALQCYKKGAEKLVCTEKDWVKLPRLLESPLDIECALGEMEVIYGKNDFEALIRKIV